MRLLTVLFLLMSTAGNAQLNVRLLNLAYGKYHVGLAQERIVYDNSIQLIITKWYPCKENTKNGQLIIKDCFLLDGLIDIGRMDSVVNDIICGEEYKIGKDTIQTFLNKKTITRRNVAPVKEKFPIVLWSYRHGTEYYQFAMNEYLASFGNIVYTVSRVKPEHKMAWEVGADEKFGCTNPI